MKKQIILPLLLAATTIGQAAAANDITRAMAPCVYPENVAASPAGLTYLPDGETYATLSPDHKQVIRYDIRSGEQTEVMLDLASTRENTLEAIDGFSISPDGSKLLVWSEVEPVYRRSFKASYYTYDIRTRLLRPLSSTFKSQQSPVFSPDGRMVAFVADNNIYVRKLDYQTEVAVTTDGAKNKIINGIPDWTYEEEFATTCSMAWAPDNLTLCFLRYDETAVPTYDMQTYGGACTPDDEAQLYPRTWAYKYPLAGKPNSTVQLISYDVDNRKLKTIELPDSRIEYIPRIAYGPDAETLVVATLNRDQNHYEIYRVNPKSTVAKSIYTEDSQSWIDTEAYEGLTLLSDGIVVNSWKSGYNALYKCSYTGSEMRRIEAPQADITAFYGADAKGNLYYQVAAPTPMDRTVVRVSLKGETTTISKPTGYSSATFAPGCKYLTMSYSNPTQVPVYTICSSEGKNLRTLEDNSAFAARTAALHAEREFVTFTTPEGVELNGYMVKPVGFSSSKKYPVVMYQYSGPGSQEVLHRWQLDWQDAFAAAGYVVICVDGRGTGGRGRQFCDIVYRRLGQYETIDQVAAARYAAGLSFCDPSRIGIFGWSYGGYEALMAATATDAPYAAAVAIAPVTDWRFYDTVYAERYMLTPQQNEDGYRSSAPLWRTSTLKCPLLIMYGTSDDNVHPANTLQFVSRLERQGDFCDMLLFPDMNHSIYGCNARSVVYAKMLHWFNKNL